MKNIAEILKDCPSGMELDCTCADNVVFGKIIEYDQIKCVIGECRDPFILDKYGRLLHICCPKCVIFPKGKTTWEGFQRPFKDGDIIYVKSNDGCGAGLISIYKNESSHLFYGHCSVSLDTETFYLDNVYGLIYKNKIGISRFATEEEKQKLFDAIKANGYKWNTETKTLEKLIEPKFKIGDRIRHIKSLETFTVIHIFYIDGEFRAYEIQIEKGRTKSLFAKNQDDYELVPNKFDISTLKPFDKVLVRNDNSQVWKCNLYSHYSEYPFHYVCINTSYKQCISFEGNEHLVGTTNDCDEYYKTW